MKVGFVPQYQKRVLGGSFDLVSPHSIALAFISQKWRTTAAAYYYYYHYCYYYYSCYYCCCCCYCSYYCF